VIKKILILAFLVSCEEKKQDEGKIVVGLTMGEKIGFAARLTPKIDYFIANKMKDSTRIYLDSLHKVCGANGSKEWIEFMDAWNFAKYKFRRQKESPPMYQPPSLTTP
jgi:hypothetical protein